MRIASGAATMNLICGIPATFCAVEIEAPDTAEWFLSIGAEGLLPGAKNGDQSVLVQMGLMSLGVGSHQYIEQQKVRQPAKAKLGVRNGV